MPDIIKKMTIVGSPNDTRDIGAEAQNVIVSYDANGNIIPDITASGVVIDHTDSATNAFAPSSHSDATNKYGAGDTTHYGHIKIGTGLEINSSTGATDIKFGAAAGTAVEGNDNRLSNDRKNPQAVTFTDGTTNVPYDGSTAVTVTSSTFGAAPLNHASAATTYGVASSSNYGHVKIGNGISNNSGTISVSLNGMPDTNFTSLANGQIQKYNSTSTKWENVTLYGDSIPMSSSTATSLTNAINGKEPARTTLTSTLAANATTLTFTNAAIGNSSLLDVYTDTFGVNPTAMTQSGTSVTLTFDAQPSAVSVRLVIRN